MLRKIHAGVKVPSHQITVDKDGRLRTLTR